MIQVTATGNLGRDAECRFLQNGTAVCGFSLGASTGFGERKKTVWLKCSKFGRGAEQITPHLTKGTKVVVVGELTEGNPWTKKDGTTQQDLEVNVQDLEFVGSGQGSPSGGQQAQKEPTQRQREDFAKEVAKAVSRKQEFDDDIPF